MSTSSEDEVVLAGPRWWQRPVVAGVVLLLVYAALSCVMSTGGSLGADTGAKVATLEVMKERGSWRPEVGYWAAAEDPGAELHGLQQTKPVGREFVVVTTLPMLLAGHLLYDVGGYRLALLLPMLGGVAAAFGSRALGRRLGADGDTCWAVYWIVGLGSPLVLYSLDFWEHAVGVGLMVWAVVHSVDAVQRGGRWWSPVVAGLLLGAAATMRTEALVVALVTIGVACVAVLAARGGWWRAARLGLLAVAGFALPWTLNVLLEHAVLRSGGSGGGDELDRASRAQDLIQGAGFRAHDRLVEGLVTLFSTASSADGAVILSGVLAVVLLLFAARVVRSGDERLATVLVGLATVVILVPMLDGPGWIPGGWVAFPAAALGLLGLVSRGGIRWVTIGALLVYPCTWAVQYLEAALPQWGGRYTLTATIVLGTCGICAAGRLGSRRFLLVLTCSCLVVTMSGLGWMSYRTHEVEHLFDQLVDRPEDVIVAGYGVFAREGMAAYTERRWLALGRGVDRDEGLEAAAEVTQKAGLSTFGVLDESPEGATEIGAFRLDGVQRYDVAGVALYLHSYALDA